MTRLLLGCALLLGGCLSPIVGAECEDNSQLCNGVCVPSGTCEWDAGTQIDAGADAGSRPVACDLGEIRCGDLCVDPNKSPDFCGSCDNSCDPGDVCSAGECLASCMAPTELCGQLCVNTNNDPDHCGGCNMPCDSGICVDNECQQAFPGHVVVIGHDYRDTREGQNRLVGNSVFLPLGTPVRVIAWGQDTPTALRNGTHRAIDQVAAETGREWIRTTASFAEDVPYALQFADVFLVYSQPNASDATLLALGDEWRVVLDTFTRLGGTVVVLDGAASNSGTYQVLEASGLFSAAGTTEITSEVLRVVSPSDGVASNVPVQYTGELSSVSFDTSVGSVVVEDPTGRAVVVHAVNF